MSDTEETISLLMVGRNGSGKSSTGNTIFNCEIFKTFAPNTVSNEAVGFHCGEVGGSSGGVRLGLVDGTCVGDTSKDLTGGERALLESLDSIWRYELEFNAILFVLKYGARFTKQEKDAVQCVKSIFGEDVFKKWGVIVMTYGDNFETDNHEKMTFEDWCREQTGDFKSLYKECDYRCVLFNNRSYSDVYWLNLRSAISKIQSPPYTKFNFNACSASRDNCIINMRKKRRNSSNPTETSPLLPRDRSAGTERRKWLTPLICVCLLVAILSIPFLAYMFNNLNKCKQYFCR